MRTNRLRVSCALVTLSLSGWSASARADFLPYNTCSSGDVAGSPCDIAGPMYDQPGVCVSETCGGLYADAGSPCLLCEPADAGTSSGSDASMSSSGGDGGMSSSGGDGSTSSSGGDGSMSSSGGDGSMSSSGGDGGMSSSGGDGGGSSGAEGGGGMADSGTDGGTSSTTASGGCSMSPFNRDGATVAAMLSLGLAAFAFGRRRRA